jgi:MoxR-like ATPase
MQSSAAGSAPPVRRHTAADFTPDFSDPASIRTAATNFRDAWADLRTAIGRVIVGQDLVVEQTLVALLANGHVLLEGVPGLGKTLLVRTLSDALDLQNRRIQFTPDVMPADITGTMLVAEDASGGGREFVFRPGPLFTQLLLADEINRATPKTQSALLEAMQERSVTVAGRTHRLDRPFLVMATQNPVEQEGTYSLPEAQLDRFLLKILVPLTDRAELNEVVTRTTRGAETNVDTVLDAEAIIAAQALAREVMVTPVVRDYVVRLVLATHPGGEHADPGLARHVEEGASPRAGQALMAAARVLALVDGRCAASIDDVARIAAPVLRHRIMLTFEADSDGVDGDEIVARLLAHVPRTAAGSSASRPAAGPAPAPAPDPTSPPRR